MKLILLIIVSLSLLDLTPGKPVKEHEGEGASISDSKSSGEDELETSVVDGDDEDEEDGSTTEEPRMRQKRSDNAELQDDERSGDFSGGDLETEDKEGQDRKEDKSLPKSDRPKNKNEPDSKELQMQNTLGIQQPFTITAMQPGRPQDPSQQMKTPEPFSLNFAGPAGKIEITPFEPAINRMKKVRRRCMCPLPCGPAHAYEVIGCGGPYTIPCGGCVGGGWPGLGCGGFGGCGGLGGVYDMIPHPGWGGYPLYGGYGGGFGCGGCGGCGGCSGCGGCGGCGGFGWGGGCGHPPIVMCCK